VTVEPRSQSRFGWMPDHPDIRDYPYSAKLGAQEAAVQLPQSAVVAKFPKHVPVVDQGNLGSCVGNSVAALHSYVRNVSMRSRLQIYYEARRMIGMENEDSGAYIRDAMKVISTLGAGRESWWPYDESKYTVDPLDKVDRDGLKRRIFNYYRLEDGQAYRTCLAAGFPFVIGFSVYSAFMSADTAAHGVVNWPVRGERFQGGHAVLVYGYDDDFANSEWAGRSSLPAQRIPKSVYICRNSWGTDWGYNGDFAIDSMYLENPNLADDAWTARRV